MAIPFLNSIDLKDYQLLNAKMHVTSTAPTAAKGQIYLDSSDNILKYHNGTTWVSLIASTSGTVTNVSSATTGQLTVSNGTSTPTLSIVTAAVTNGGSALATGDQIYDFVTGLGYVESIDVNGSTFISITDGGTATDPTFTVSLSATGTPDNTVYLRGDNTWSPISTIPGTYTWNLTGDTGTSQAVGSGNTVTISGGTMLSSTIGAGPTLTINHDNVTRTDTTSSASPSFGGTFTAVDSVTSSATGHITALNLKTVTLPTPTDTNTTYELAAGAISGGAAILLNGSDLSQDVVRIYGTTNEIEVTRSGNDITVGLPNDVVIAGNLTVIGTTTTNNVETVSTTNGVVFEGNAADGNELTLLAGTLTADQTIYLPNASGTIALTSDLAARTYATTIADTATITHNLSTRDVVVQLYDIVTYETIYADVVRTTTNTATITFGSTPVNSIRVLVTKIG
jgi:hypothetical protein